MITSSRIIALVILFLSVVMAFICALTDIFKPVKYKKFYLATTVVYITGNILITSIVCINKSIPLAFTLISEFTIICIYAFSMFMIYRLTSSIVELQKAAPKDDKSESKEDN